MTADLKPIDPAYLRDDVRIRPGSRLHQLVARLGDTHIDDLTDARIAELEQLADTYRITHADGSRFASPTHPSVQEPRL